MNSFIMTTRSLFKKGRSNVIKIISLGTGLAVGLVLISKVNFEMNFDDFYPDSDRVYQIWENFEVENGGDSNWNPRVSGGIAVGMKDEISEIESATRFTYITAPDATFFTLDRKRYSGQFILADSCLFDVLPRPMIAGNAKDILSRSMYCIVSKSIADKMGENVIGKQIQLDIYPNRILTIGGIFEDIPENSHCNYDVIISMSSIAQFTWDGSMNWLGNDRYMSYVKLRPGITDVQSLAPAMHNMQKKYQDLEQIKKSGMDLYYTLHPLKGLHNDTPEVKRMTLILSIIAFALIFTAILNYLLIVMTTLVGRSKEIAVYKCYGATAKDITKMMFTETFFHFVLSLILAVLLILIFRGTVEELLSASLGALFSFQAIVLLLCVCICIFFIAAVFPSYTLSHIPVAAVFRTFNSIGSRWKLVLLFVQFVAAAFLLTLLVIVGRQYNMMVNDNPGYTYNKTMYCDVSGADSLSKQTVLVQLKQLAEVEMVSLATDLPFSNFSGNNVSIPGSDKELFNIADMYFADENYFPLMEIPLVEGQSFSSTSNQGDILVSRLFTEKMKTLEGWEDGVVGKEVYISEHGLCRIAGVFENVRLGSINKGDIRASAIFYSQSKGSTLLVKLNTVNGENIQKLYDILKTSMPEKDIVLIPYSDSMLNLYNGERLFKDAITIGGLITILITLIGLIGYLNNEIVRRTSEIAIRKINGATLCDILGLFIKNISKIAVLALVLGGIAAAFVGNKWMENFSDKISLHPILFIVCALMTLLIVQIIVIVNCLKIANQNPIDSLRRD